jgi:hypothetical protein
MLWFLIQDFQKNWAVKWMQNSGIMEEKHAYFAEDCTVQYCNTFNCALQYTRKMK